MCKDCEAKDAEIGRLNAAVESVCKGSFGASEALAKDNADLRTQLNTANAAAGELSEWACKEQGIAYQQKIGCGDDIEAARSYFARYQTLCELIDRLDAAESGTSLLRETEQSRAALAFYANEHNYNDDPSDIPGCPVPGTAPIWVDHGGKAQQALKAKL